MSIVIDYYSKPVFNYYRKKKQVHPEYQGGIHGHPMDTQCLIFVRHDIQDIHDSSDSSDMSIVSVK